LDLESLALLWCLDAWSFFQVLGRWGFGAFPGDGFSTKRPFPATLPPMSLVNQPLAIAGRIFRSRLILGTGKFSSPETMRDALAASGAEMVTVALRRADLSGKRDPFANILEFIDPKQFLLLPNTSGAMNAEEAVRLARLAAAAGLPKWVKLEIHPDPRYLLPDPVETFKAAEILVKEGFTVLPYINADPVLAKRLQEAGVATVMPLGSPIGSNRGVQTRDQIRIIIEQATVPVVWMPASALPAMPPKRWNSAPTPCSSIPPSPFPPIPTRWQSPSKWPWKPAAPPSKPAWPRSRKPPAPRAP